MKKTKRIILVLMTILLMVIGTTIVSASTTYVYNKGDWKVRLDSPNTDGKTYWHLHFYQKGKHVYCLKLNNSFSRYSSSRTCMVLWSFPAQGIFSKCPQNKMAYEMIMVYHLHMPFFIALFPCILT